MSSSPKKYLSLEESAQRLAVSTDQLVRMRENGEIRGFADRGTWKFRVEDVEEVARARQHDSSPEVPLLDDGPMVMGAGDDAASAAVFNEEVGEQPTVIRTSSDAGKASDSDVKLIGAGADSDSDITLSPSDDIRGSDSDVKLVGEAAGDGSDSDVQLIDPSEAGDDSSDSDVALIGGSDSTVALDLAPDDSEEASVLSDDAGLALNEGSSLTLAADSGISLEADEGITLDMGTDSGISLETIGDSGISLEDSNEFSGTVPLMDAMPAVEGVDETKFEIPAVTEDSAFDMEMSDADDATGVLNLEDSGQTQLDDAVFDLDDEEAAEGSADDLEVAADILGEDDELEDLDIFDADEGLFEESGASQEFAAPVAGRAVVVEQEWSGMVVGSLIGSSLVMLLATIISFDLVRSMWQWNGAEPTPITSSLLSMFGGG